MVYQLNRILSDVRVCLDENASGAALLTSGDVDTLMLDSIIEAKITEATDRVHSEAPYYLLEQGHYFGDNEEAIEDGEGHVIIPAGEVAIYWDDQESGHVLLPPDFMRLVVFEMSDWERPVYAVTSANDPVYAKQRSRVKALRGTVQRPVCVLGVRPEGRVLEFYSCKSEEATVTRAVYIPYAEIKDDGSGNVGVDISERCYDAVVYTAAALVLTTQGEPEKANVLFEKSKTYLQK